MVNHNFRKLWAKQKYVRQKSIFLLKIKNSTYNSNKAGIVEYTRLIVIAPTNTYRTIFKSDVILLMYLKKLYFVPNTQTFEV